MSKHTPGPWVAKPHGVIVGGVLREYVNGAAQDQIAMACTVDPENGSQQENARLIAASPEMLEALQDFSAYVHAEQSATDGTVQYSNTQIHRLAFKARAAIAKATEGP